MLEIVTTPTLEADPACPEAAEAAVSTATQSLARPIERSDRAAAASLSVRQVRFDDLDPAVWDDLAGRAAGATPFSQWAFHRAWWAAYGDTAHDQTLVVERPDAEANATPVAIIPLMHRHEVEPSDAETRSTIRHGRERGLTPVAPTAKAVFFGASYHCDYATILAAPDDLPAVARATAAQERRVMSRIASALFNA